MVEVVHCLFIAAKDGTPWVINLSNTYSVAYPSSQTMAITRNAKRYVIKSVKDAGVAGMAVLYGENGAGKTGAMIDVANVFGDDPKGKTAGGLYQRDGRLFLRRGKALRNYSIVSEEPVSIEDKDAGLRCMSVFYTTSPFDAGRRGRLKHNSLARDVSPTYGERIAFDGLSLLEVSAALGMPFIERADIRIRLTVKSVSSAFIAISNKLGNNRNPHVHIARRAVVAAASALPGHEQMQLRCWLSLFVAVHERADRGFPVKFARLLDSFPSSSDPRTDLYELWKTAIRACRSCMSMSEMTQVMALLQQLSQTEFTKMLAKPYTPAGLLALIEHYLPGRHEDLRRCADLGLLEFSIGGLSSGETAYAMLFSSLYGGLTRVSQVAERRPIFLLLDEGEMFLHPSWQREYIAKLLEFVQRMPRLKGRLHLLLATHSLIVAADAPPHSLVDVATGKQVNGFGLGPRSTLAEIYKVKVFHGENSETEFKRIEEFISRPRREDYSKVMALTASLADVHVQEFLEGQITEAMERSGA